MIIYVRFSHASSLVILKRGGGELVYGKRASELSVGNYTKAIEIYRFAHEGNNTGSFNYVPPSDGVLHIYTDNSKFAGIKPNYWEGKKGWATLVRTTESNLACFLPVKKGESYSFHFSSNEGYCFFSPMK